MRYLLILFLCLSCNKQPDPSEEYVLIEFAARLESEYHKLNPPESQDKVPSESQPRE